MRLVTLGQFRLQDGQFNRPKLWLLLTYLAIEGPQDRRFLAELFWGEAADPMTSMRVAVANLRRKLPGHLLADGHELATCLTVDAAELLNHLESGNDSQAVSLYTGAFLQGRRHTPGSAELEEWVFGTRESLADRVVEAHIRLGERAAAQGDTAAAVRHATDAWQLPGRSPLIADDLEHLHHLLQFGSSPLLGLSRREAESFGLHLGSRRVHEAQAVADDAGLSAVCTQSSPQPCLDPDLLELATQLVDRCLLRLNDDGSVELHPLLAAAAAARYQVVAELGRNPMP